ncbi:LysR substrate-binding domain-containing protein [Roseomonas sp. NAR14]|uniref:LysR substrate-binding domain-containing protein n=1 Tax=Roseomonas acroporae TaxID=2937791 RepID=A0A9X1Y466_9PROT|nr:LysR substrate-binding domain-containing protein [Roseomonas acroporae]MCK8783231.1 LysR substrate-binding domain-containing protein [Roseomonas acroporae]
MAIQPEESGLQRLDLNLLPLFAALMRHRSVTRAGQSLFLSQPATSAALARLRLAFRDELFLRNGRVLEPTARAEALMAELEPVLAAINRAVAGATPFDPATDVRLFRVGWSDDVAIAGMGLVERVRRRAPACRLVLRNLDWTTAPAMLESGEVGTAVAYLDSDLPANVRRRVLRRGPFRVLRDAGSPGPVDLDAYCARPHVLVTAHGDLQGFADDRLEALGRSRRVVVGVPSFGLLDRVVRGTDLLCTTSEMLTGVLTADGALAADPLPFATPESTIHMAWRSALEHDPAEAWLRRQIVEVMAGRHADGAGDAPAPAA